MTDHVTPPPAMGTTAAHASWSSAAVVTRVLAAVTAVLLAVDAYVHLHDASQYDSFKSSVMSEGTLFRIQGVVAIVVAVAVLVWPRMVTWIISILVAGSAAVAVVLYTYVNVGPLGPLPNLYEATWEVPGKEASAIAEGAATLVAIAGLVMAIRMRRRAAHGSHAR